METHLLKLKAKGVGGITAIETPEDVYYAETNEVGLGGEIKPFDNVYAPEQNKCTGEELQTATVYLKSKGYFCFEWFLMALVNEHLLTTILCGQHITIFIHRRKNKMAICCWQKNCRKNFLAYWHLWT